MAYRDSTSGSDADGSTFSVTVPSVAENDIVLIVTSQDNSSSPTHAVTGFTQLDTITVTLDGQRVSLFWRRASASEGSSYSGTSTNAAELSWICGTWSGRDTGNPPVHNTSSENSGAASPVSVTNTGLTALDGDDLAYFGCPDVDTINVGNGFAAPTNFTERQDVIDGAGGWVNLTLASRDNVSAGVTGSITGTLTLSGGTAAYTSFVVRIPAGAAPTNPVVAPPVSRFRRGRRFDRKRRAA